VGLLDEWRFCPRCGEAIEKRDGRAVCPACGFRAYANSAPTASALVVDDRGRVLLARRAFEPYRGCWDFPGGFLEEDEHPLECLRREVREETGLEIEPIAYVDTLMDWYGPEGMARSTLNLIWTARLVAGEPVPDDDVAELRWFPADELPVDDDIAFSMTGELLRSWLRNKDA
jgi:ADP-ribose pyrophosphatase YjhB (NUDIX family)